VTGFKSEERASRVREPNALHRSGALESICSPGAHVSVALDGPLAAQPDQESAESRRGKPAKDCGRHTRKVR
jgi:hypothetical protein